MNYLEEENIEEDSIYPPKPILRKPELNKRDSINRSLVSMGLFILIFYLFFDVEVRFLFIVIAVLIIHELGHFVAMERFGYKDLKIFFVPLLGAYVSGENKDISQKQKVLIYMAGPIPGIIIGFIFLGAYYLHEHENFLYMSSIFIYINVFNLIPVTPLDGGRIIETLFFYSNKVFQVVFMFVSALAIIALSVYFEVYIMIFFALILGGRIMNEIIFLRVKRELKKQGLYPDKTFDELSDEEYWKIRDVLISKARYFRNVEKGIYIPDSREPMIINQITSLLEKKPIKDLKAGAKTIYFIIWFIFLTVPTALTIISLIMESVLPGASFTPVS